MSTTNLSHYRGYFILYSEAIPWWPPASLLGALVIWYDLCLLEWWSNIIVCWNHYLKYLFSTLSFEIPLKTSTNYNCETRWRWCRMCVLKLRGANSPWEMRRWVWCASHESQRISIETDSCLRWVTTKYCKNHNWKHGGLTKVPGEWIISIKNNYLDKMSGKTFHVGKRETILFSFVSHAEVFNSSLCICMLDAMHQNLYYFFFLN